MPVARPPDVVDGHDGRMIQRSHDAGLGPIGFHRVRIRTASPMRHFDRHVPPEFLVRRVVDPRESTFPQHAQHSITADRRQHLGNVVAVAFPRAIVVGLRSDLPLVHRIGLQALPSLHVLLLFTLLQGILNAAEFSQLVRQLWQQIGMLCEHILVRYDHSLGSLLRNVEHDLANPRRSTVRTEVVRGSG